MASPSPTERLVGLRALLKLNDVSACVVPSQDAHNSEYIADYDKRRGFISGFTGSAGTAVVTETQAALWTDGRYWVQASQQLHDSWQLMKAGHRTEKPQTPFEWLREVLPVNSKVGIDPFVTTINFYRRYIEKCGDDLSVTLLKSNLVDSVWKGRPLAPKCPISAHPLQFSGQPSSEKIEMIKEQLEKEKCFAIVITALDEICWLLNIRGADISYNPVVISYVIVTTEGTSLFVDPEKVSDEVKEHLGDVDVKPYETIIDYLASLKIPPEQKVWIDPASCNMAIYQTLPNGYVLEKTSPIPLKKAVKNETEIQGFRNAHIRDGAAKTAWIAWLDETLTDENKEGLTEVDVADKLEEYRRQQQFYVGLSFPTISSIGSNGAIIHYTPTKENCAVMNRNEMYLVDSGAQYLDGTTDVTRTVHLGTPSQHEKECFTRVLKGHIALASVRFPQGTIGTKLDVMARQFLWQDGLDYVHGTGHGVGSFLNVHEGPHRISSSLKLSINNEPGLVAGVTMTNEPGYYEAGKFGIRIETVMLCRESKTKFNFNDLTFYEWDTITFVPLQKSLIDFDLLSKSDIDWVNSYHKQCLDVLEPQLKNDERALRYLRESCKPIQRWSVNVNMIE